MRCVRCACAFVVIVLAGCGSNSPQSQLPFDSEPESTEVVESTPATSQSVTTISTEAALPATTSTAGIHFIDCGSTVESVVNLDVETGSVGIRRSGVFGLCSDGTGSNVVSVSSDGRYAVSFWGLEASFSQFNIVDLEDGHQRVITDKDIRAWISTTNSQSVNNDIRDVGIIGFDRSTAQVFFLAMGRGLPSLGTARVLSQNLGSLIDRGMNPSPVDNGRECHFSFRWSPGGQACASRAVVGERGVFDLSGPTRFYPVTAPVFQSGVSSESSRFPLECDVDDFVWASEDSIFIAARGSIVRGDLNGTCTRYFLDSGLRPSRLLGAADGIPIVWSLSQDASQIEVMKIPPNSNPERVTELSAAMSITETDLAAQPRPRRPLLYWRLQGN